MEILIVKASQSEVKEVKTLEMVCGLSSWSLDDYSNEILRQDSIFLTAKIKGKVVGYLLARLIKSQTLYFSNTESEIYNFGVNPNFRNLGIGSALINRYLDLAKKHNVTNIFLEVRASNKTAIHFYLKNKFKIIARRQDFYSTPIEDALLMSREFQILGMN